MTNSKPSLETESNQCNAYNAYNAYNVKEKRVNHCIRLRASIHEAVRDYCHGARMNIGAFYEDAAITYFQVNPLPEYLDNIVIVRESDITESTLEDSIQDIICVGELEEFISSSKTNLKYSGVLQPYKLKEFSKLLKECNKVSVKSTKHKELLEEAVGLVKQSYV